jgi:hypothetical protein
MQDYRRELKILLLIINIVSLLLILANMEFKINKWLASLGYFLFAIASLIGLWKLRKSGD